MQHLPSIYIHSAIIIIIIIVIIIVVFPLLLTIVLMNPPKKFNGSLDGDSMPAYLDGTRPLKCPPVLTLYENTQLLVQFHLLFLVPMV